VAAVAFAVGSRPEIPGDDALDLAELLMRRRSLAADRLGQKIKANASRDPDGGETSEDIEPDADELAVLAALLEEEPWPKEQPWYANLREQVDRERGGG
jgi:hypothetical protein